MTKKKGKRKDEFVVDIPMAERTTEFEDMLTSLGPDATKARLIGASRPELDKWVTEIAGRPSHSDQENGFVVESICRYIDGDANWGDDPKRMEPVVGNGNGAAEEASAEDATTEADATEAEAAEIPTTHEQAETPEEDAMKKNGTKKEVAKKSAVAKAQKAGLAPKSVPPKAEKVKKEGSLPTGKTSGKTRAAFILDLLVANRKEKLSDAALLTKAQKEFGENLVPGESGTFTIGHQRGVSNKDRLLGKRGLKKTDAEFVEYDKPVTEKKAEKK